MPNTTNEKLAATVRGLPLSVYKGVSDETNDEVANYMVSVSRLRANIERLDAAVQDAIDEAGDPDTDPLRLDTALAERSMKQREAIQTAIRLWTQRGTLAGKMADEIRELVGPASDAFDDAFNAVGDGLARIGLGIEAMVASGNNSAGAYNEAAADIQWDNIVMLATPVRKAKAGDRRHTQPTGGRDARGQPEFGGSRDREVARNHARET